MTIVMTLFSEWTSIV